MGAHICIRPRCGRTARANETEKRGMSCHPRWWSRLRQSVVQAVHAMGAVGPLPWPRAAVLAPSTVGLRGLTVGDMPIGRLWMALIVPGTGRRRDCLRGPGARVLRLRCCRGMALWPVQRVVLRCRWWCRHPQGATPCAFASRPAAPLTKPGQTQTGPRGSSGGFCEGAPAWVDYRVAGMLSIRVACPSIDADQARAYRGRRSGPVQTGCLRWGAVPDRGKRRRAAGAAMGRAVTVPCGVISDGL